MSGETLETAAKAAGYGAGAVLLGMAYLEMFLRVISRKMPWSRGRYIPLLPLKIRTNFKGRRRDVVRAVAVGRFFGSPPKSPHRDLMAWFSIVYSTRRGLAIYTSLLIRGLSVPLIVWLLYSGIAGVSSFEVNDAIGAAAYSYTIFAMLAWWRIFAIQRNWRRRIADLEAFGACLSILHRCGEKVRGGYKGGALVIDLEVTSLCRYLGDFVASPTFSLDGERRASVARHVAEVQRVLMEASAGVLASGNDGLATLVGKVTELADGLYEERWLRLIEIPDAPDSNAVTQSSDSSVDKRDAWIVVGGSVLAALGLGVAVALGVPVAAAVPAALIFLLGPATIWGSRRLGMSPKNLLESVRAPIVEAGQGGAPPQQPAGQGQASSVGAGSP